MDQTFYFYDLETSGVSPKNSRIMQFGGQRTTLDLKPIGEPHNILIKMSNDILPEPDAVLVTGITPQKTLAEGVSEAEFLKLFEKEIATENTIFVGFNSVRFDDEFMRYLLYRNFYDPYEWQWTNGKSRWDLMDVARMMRALRPEGVNWPFSPEGKPTVSLEYLTALNNIKHDGAHDALSDVLALIDVAKMIQLAQPKLFNYLLELRTKQKVSELIESSETFVYTSGKYPSEYQKTTLATVVAPHPSGGGAYLVYDLRVNPKQYFDLSVSEIVKLWKPDYKKGEERTYFALKTLKNNRCPAVAPSSVIDENAAKNIGLDLKQCQDNLKMLHSNQSFIDKIVEAAKLLDTQQAEMFANTPTLSPEEQLYDGFFGDNDRRLMANFRRTKASEMSEFKFTDQRLSEMILPYKARNFTSQLSKEEKQRWNALRKLRLTSARMNIDRFFQRISELESQNPSRQKNSLLSELKEYGELLLKEPG